MSSDQNMIDVDTELIALAMHKLSIDNTNVTDVLTDCNIYLNKLNRSDLFKSANLIDLNLIFDCLNSSDPKQIEMTCVLLQKLFNVLLPSYVFKKYSVCIGRALHHPSAVVKSTILSEMEKVLATNIDPTIGIKVDLVCSIIDCLANSDISVSYNAVKCLKIFHCIETLSSRSKLSKFRSIVMMDAKIRTRVYDVLIHWAKSEDYSLALISSKGLFSNLVTDITYPDVMMQMVTIQMLIPLSITEHGFDYLNSVGIIRGLYRILSAGPKELNDSLDVILNPIVLEFFIKITQVRPHLILTTYPKVFVVIYEALKDGDYSLVGIAMNAISTLASSWDCKIVLDIPASGIAFDSQDDEELDIWSIFIIELGHIVTSTKTELKAGALQAITKIIQIESGELSSRNDMITRTQKWYKQIKDNPIKNIVYTSCSLPFLEIQQAGLEMLLSLVEQPWGQEEITKCPRLLDIVFDNSPKDPIIIRDLKREIIKTLSKSETIDNIFNEDLLLRIKNTATTQANANLYGGDMFVEDMAM